MTPLRRHPVARRDAWKAIRAQQRDVGDQARATRAWPRHERTQLWADVFVVFMPAMPNHLGLLVPRICDREILEANPRKGWSTNI